MFCRVCNSRIRPGGTACPNCGSHSIVRQETATGGSTALPPAVINEDPNDPIHPGRVEDGTRTAPDAGGEERMADPGYEPAEVELSEPAHLERPRSDLPPEQKKQAPPASHLGGDVARGSFAAALDADGLRSLLDERPEILEAGLRVFTNDKGTPLGSGYTTSVGEIHLLARDASDGFVVVMLAGKDSAEQLVSGVLQRIGWVRKHLASGDRDVRGIVLLDAQREDIAYAAAAVSDTVTFKTYRVAVCFEDLSF